MRDWIRRKATNERLQSETIRLFLFLISLATCMQRFEDFNLLIDRFNDLKACAPVLTTLTGNSPSKVTKPGLRIGEASGM